MATAQTELTALVDAVPIATGPIEKAQFFHEWLLHLPEQERKMMLRDMITMFELNLLQGIRSRPDGLFGDPERMSQSFLGYALSARVLYSVDRQSIIELYRQGDEFVTKRLPDFCKRAIDGYPYKTYI